MWQAFTRQTAPATRYWPTILEVDKLNPQMASRLAEAFATWAKLDAERQGLVQVRLKALNQQKDSLSKSTFEVVSTVLGAKA